MSPDDGFSHSHASQEGAAVIEARTVYRYHRKNINNRTYSAVFSTHINHDAGTVLLFIAPESLAGTCRCWSNWTSARVV